MSLNYHFSKVQEKQWMEGIIHVNKYDLTSVALGFDFTICCVYTGYQSKLVDHLLQEKEH